MQDANKWVFIICFLLLSVSMISHAKEIEGSALSSLYEQSSKSLAKHGEMMIEAELDDMRGRRYCEVIFFHGFLGYVYNTINLNNCPEQIWNSVTTAVVKEVTGSHFVYLNGPRYFVMDKVLYREKDFSHVDLKTFEGIGMRRVGVLHITLLDLIKGSAPYREHKVDRKNTWVFQVGKPVYELIDPEGQVFVMQSYSEEMNTQPEVSLSRLGSRLTLPSGWRFRTGILMKDQHLLVVNNQAIVILDDFKNAYQLASRDFLEE
ncbi:MAG: hypothetical protein Q8R24_00060 [Legionellaceae bacterium]|nr:hypothetical protein [Legionellaceae bacterium]